MTDVIELRGLRFDALVGVLPDELERSQPIEVDLDVHADLARAGASDDLDDTIDYGAVCAAVEGVVDAGHVALLERLAQCMVDAVLAVDGRVIAVTLAVRKLRPPVSQQLDTSGVRITRSPVRAFIGLGSNLGDREASLRKAVRSMSDVVAVSPVYETDPVGGPEQGAYLNAVVELDTASSPRELLGLCRSLEEAAERVRVEHWGPRTLDADVLLVGDLHVDEPDLVVPHPRLWERRFVLAPLRDLAPDLVSAEQIGSAEGEVTRTDIVLGAGLPDFPSLPHPERE